MVEYLDKIGLTYLWGKLKTLLNGKVDKVSSTDNAVPRFNGTEGKIQNSGVTINDYNMLIAPAIKAGNTVYAIANNYSTLQVIETVLKTRIKWRSSSHMPVLHISGYAYGMQSPIEFKIGFYIYNDKIGYCGVTNMGSWAPKVYLFKYTVNNVDYVAVGLTTSSPLYYPSFSLDVQSEVLSKFNYISLDKSGWYFQFYTEAGNIPEADDGVTCVSVPYKADILSQKWGQITNKPTTLSGYGITDAINTSSTAQTKQGNFTAAKFIKSGGTSNQFLKADGSVDETAYLPVNGNAASATMATQDESGNNIEATYQKKADVPAAITNAEMDSVLEDSIEVETTETNNE